MHDGYHNTYSFTKDCKHITLIPIRTSSTPPQNLNMETMSPFLTSPNTPKQLELEPQEVDIHNSLDDRETFKNYVKGANKGEQWPLGVHEHAGKIHVQVLSLRTNFSKEGENNLL